MLTHHGVICVKENLSSDGFLVDRQDSSLTRSDVHFKQVKRKPQILNRVPAVYP